MKYAICWISLVLVASSSVAGRPTPNENGQLRKHTLQIERCKFESGKCCENRQSNRPGNDSNVATAGIGSSQVVAAVSRLFDTSDFPPRWRCGTWSTFQGWLHIVSDVLIWLSYVAIPVILIYFARRRPDVPYSSVFFLFGAFIVLCGLTHLLEAAIFWWPAYRLLGLVKALTAVVSIATVVALVPIVPKALSLKSAAQLEHEIEHRKNIEAALRQSEQRFERAVTGSTDGLWDWNLATGKVWYSARCMKLMGIGDKESIRSLDTWRERLHPEDAPAVRSALNAHLELGTPFDVEYRLCVHDTIYSWFRTRGIAFRNDRGEPIQMSGSVQDIHAQKRAEDALRQREQEVRHTQKMEAVGSLAGGVAHEFNNLLQAIRGLTSFAMDELPDGQAQDDLRQALVTTDRASALTRQLLNFSRREQFSLSHIHPDEVITELVTMVRPLIGEQIELSVSLGDDVGMIHADSNQLQQALMNLCVNARDAMPSGGTLAIRTQAMRVDSTPSDSQQLAPGDYVRIQITDDGCGIPEDVQERIFDPFFTTKPVGEGTGLGLAMVYAVVKQHRGAIHVRSGAKVGSTFEICLPIDSREAVSEDPPFKPSLGDLRGSCETILIAEDESAVRDVEVRILERAGYRTIAVDNGRDAVRAFRRQSDVIDLVMLDVIMPGMSGHDAHHQIQQIRPDARVIFCTGYDPDIAHTERLVEQGYSIVQKPFTTDSLLQVIYDELQTSPCAL